MSEIPTRTNRFTELSRTRCLELLTDAHVGRVAWHGGEGLQILPVSYAYHQNLVVFRTSPYGSLSELVRPTDVVLEIDELDQTQRTGWSVVVHGRAEAVAAPQELVRLWAVDGVSPWASGVRNLFIQITPTRISGRILERELD